MPRKAAQCSELRTQALEMGQAELHVPEPTSMNLFELLGCSRRDEGDNLEQMYEHWFGLRKPNAPLALSPTGCLCGLEEVTMVPGGGEERIGEKLCECLHVGA